MIGTVHGRHALPFHVRLPYPLFRVWRIYRVARFWAAIKLHNLRVKIRFYVTFHPVVHAYVLTVMVCAAYVLGMYFSH